MPRKELVKHTPKFMRWGPDEYMKVAVNALEVIDKGTPVIDAFLKVQKRVLGRDRWRKASELTGPNRAVFKKYAAEARTLSAKERAKFVVAVKVADEDEPEPLAPAPVMPKDGRGRVTKWVTLEKAQIARIVQKLQAADPNRSLTACVLEAQAQVLPEWRQRSKSVLYVASAQGYLKRDMEEGAKNIWVLEKQERVEAERVKAASDALAREQLQQSRAIEFQAPEAPAMVQAPTPAPALHGTIADAAAAFGARMQEALGELLQATMVHTVNALGARIDKVANDVGLSIAAQIQRGLQGTVHELLAQELGPLSTAPAPAPVAPPAPEVPKGPRLKVDVVGLIGQNVQQVRDAFNGHTDLRFIDVDQVARWDVRKDSSVVVVTKFVSHKVTDKIKQAGLKPIHVNGGAPVVIHAIEELHRVQGVPV